MARNLSESANIAVGLSKPEGRLKYLQLFKEEYVARTDQVDRLQLQIEALTSTLKTENAMAQSAMQQVAALNKELAGTRTALIEMKKKYEAISPPDSEETEVKGE